MKKRIWHTHTGSAPGCQDNPRAIINNWFNGHNFRLTDARACFNNLIELEEADGTDEHRCFNRREYALDLQDVRRIIWELKREANHA